MRAAAAALALGALVWGCRTDAGPQGAATSIPGKRQGAEGTERLERLERESREGGASVEIVGRSFRPRSLRVTRGSVVRWRNEDDEVHTVSPLLNGPLQPGEEASYTAQAAGVIPYVCSIHGEPMSGELRVT